MKPMRVRMSAARRIHATREGQGASSVFLGLLEREGTGVLEANSWAYYYSSILGGSVGSIGELVEWLSDIIMVVTKSDDSVTCNTNSPPRVKDSNVP
jgi:hypothetical protein